MAEEKKTDVELAMEEAEREEKVRGPQDPEEIELTDEQKKVAEEFVVEPVRDPSADLGFARSDQHPSFDVPTAQVAPAEETATASASKSTSK